jgi:hypothetical protein
VRSASEVPIKHPTLNFVPPSALMFTQGSSKKCNIADRHSHIPRIPGSTPAVGEGAVPSTNSQVCNWQVIGHEMLALGWISPDVSSSKISGVAYSNWGVTEKILICKALQRHSYIRAIIKFIFLFFCTIGLHSLTCLL